MKIHEIEKELKKVIRTVTFESADFIHGYLLALKKHQIMQDAHAVTDVELESLKGAIEVLEQVDHWHAAGEARIKTLRGLWERFAKGGEA